MRHGETDWNKQWKLQGSCDIPLNENGEKMAGKTAEGFVRDGIRFDMIFSSPLIRAKRTAEIMRQMAGNADCGIVTDPRLREISFGIYEGMEKTKVPEEFSRFFKDPEHYVPAQGGESYPEAIERTGAFLREVLFPYAERPENAGKNVLIAGHGGMDETLIIQLGHMQIADIWKGPFKNNCCITVFELADGDSVQLGDPYDYLGE